MEKVGAREVHKHSIRRNPSRGHNSQTAVPFPTTAGTGQQTRPVNPNTMRYELANYFMLENHAWDDLITRHKRELPRMKDMLGDIVRRKSLIGEDTRAGVDQLCYRMNDQEASLGQLQEHLSLQQQYLSRRTNDDINAESDPLDRQNALRTQIRHASQDFLQLKSQMMNYMSIIA